MSSIKRDVKKKSFPTTGAEIFSRHPAHLGYASLSAVVPFHSHKIIPLPVMTPSSSRERQVTVVEYVNHGSIRSSWPMTISGYARGHNVI
jgi:hypothetical protein